MYIIRLFVDNNQLPSVINDCMGVDGKLISTYAPGMEPVIFPNTDYVKMGMTIEANSNIILQMHYPAGSIGQSIAPQSIYFYDDNVQNIREVFIERLLENWNLFIQQITLLLLALLILLETIFSR